MTTIKYCFVFIIWLTTCFSALFCCFAQISPVSSGFESTEASDGSSFVSDRQFNVAAELQNSGDFQGALQNWTSFIEKNGSDSRINSALYYRSVCNFQLQRYTEAIGDLRRLLDLPGSRFEKREDALYFAALANQRLSEREPHRLEAAKILWETLLKEYPQSSNWANATFRLASIYYQQKKYELAISRYRQVVQRAPKSDMAPLSVIEIGRSLLDLRRAKDAISYFNYFLKNWPNHERQVDALLLLGDAQFDLNLITSAEKSYRLCCLAAKGQESAITGLDYALIRWGDCLQLLDKTAEASAAYERVIQDFSQSDFLADACLNSARCMTKLNQTDKALGYLNKARADKRTEVPARFLLVQLYLKSDKAGEALKELEGVPEELYSCKTTDPEDVQTLTRSYCLLRAKTWYANADRLKDSLALWQHIAKRWPQSQTASWSLYMAAQVSFQIKDWDACITLCNQVQQSYPKSEEVLETRILSAESLFLQEKYQQAGEQYKDLFQNNDQDDRRWGWLVRAAWSYDQQGNSQQVKDLLFQNLKFVRSDEFRPEALYCLGKALFELKDTANSRKALEICRDRYPSFPARDRVLFVLGQLYESSQLKTKALESYQELQEKYPGSAILPNALYQMGQLKAQTMDSRQSLEYYEKLLALPKENPLRRDALLDSAFILMDSGENQKAFERAEEYIKDYPDEDGFLEACYLQALTSEQMKQFDQAIERANIGLEKILSLQKEAQQNQTEIVAKPGRELGGLTLGISSQDSELSETEKNNLSWKIKLLVVIANCYVQQNRLDDAVQTLSQTFKIQKESGVAIPHQDGISFLYAETLLKTGERDLAKQCYEQTYQQFPKSSYHASLAYALGCLAVEEKNYSAAAPFFEETMKTGSPELAAKANSQIAWSLNLQGQFEAASKQFVSTIERINQIPEVDRSALIALLNDSRFMKAECAYFQNKYQEAFDLYKDLSDILPDKRLQSGYHQAQCANQLEQYDSALEIVSQSLSDDGQQLKAEYLPDARGLYPALLYEKAYALFKLEKKDEAQQLFEKITEWSDQHANEIKDLAAPQTAAAKSWFYLGELLFQAEKYDEAIRRYYNVIYGFPCPDVQADACYESARCFEMLKMIPRAVKQYQRIVDMYPDSSKAGVAKQKLQELK